tara:strand:+ start:431 stop:772 length:342 start_codon:yes stop_codon:yes gene_type:complete
MPRKLPPKNSSWVQLTKDFVKEWPEVLDGLHFTNMPVRYLVHINLYLKNDLILHYSIKNVLKKKKERHVASFLKNLIQTHYKQIKNVDLKFDVPALKSDMENKTRDILSKTFK